MLINIFILSVRQEHNVTLKSIAMPPCILRIDRFRWAMIRGGFLSAKDRNQLIALARDGSAASRLTRRANALVLLDDGWSCQEVADALLLNDDTIRGWHKLFEQRGIEGLTSFEVGGSASFLSAAQEEALKVFVSTTLPRSTRQVGAFIEQEFGLVYESRSGLIALLHRLGLEYHKPEVIPRKLDPDKQKAFIESYDKLLNSLGNDETVLFVDAVHPTHAARPVGCWAPKQDNLAIEQTSGRERINIHGAINLESGQTRMIDVQTVDAASTINLLEAIEALYPLMILIHVFLDNARYHHAKLVQEWLERPGCRIRLHFIPSYCPHLNPIERLWGVMHRNVTHNKCYATVAQFADATLGFLRENVPRNWPTMCDLVTDNFRVITPRNFRVIVVRQDGLLPAAALVTPHVKIIGIPIGTDSHNISRISRGWYVEVVPRGLSAVDGIGGDRGCGFACRLQYRRRRGSERARPEPLPPALVAEIEKRNMPQESPILVRIFKEESELEVWKQNAEGKFALLKTYPICRWSGELGPKVKEGDRQAPEGFYNITPGQMNPNSNYYLAFNLGFPERL